MSWLDRLERLAVIIGSTCLAVLAISVFAQVALRYGFSITPFWGEELNRDFLIVAVLLGAAASVRGSRHIRVEFIVDLLPLRLQHWWRLLLDLLTLVLFAILVVTGINAVQFNMAQLTVAMQIPVAWLMLFVPLGFALAFLFGIGEIRKRWRQGP